MDDAEVLDHTLGSTVAGGRVPGLAVAVVADGEVVRVGTRGSADAATNLLVDLHTPFLWFSMTKIVTATAAMHLVDEGRLGLDDDVEQLGARCPARRRRRSGPCSTPTSTQRRNPESAPDPVGAARIGAAAQRRRLRARAVRSRAALRFAPGTRAAYTNLGYLLLGAVIEAAARKPYTDYATEEVLAPLGMHDTGFVLLGDAGRWRLVTSDFHAGSGRSCG